MNKKLLPHLCAIALLILMQFASPFVHKHLSGSQPFHAMFDAHDYNDYHGISASYDGQTDHAAADISANSHSEANAVYVSAAVVSQQQRIITERSNGSVDALLLQARYSITPAPLRHNAISYSTEDLPDTFLFFGFDTHAPPSI